MHCINDNCHFVEECNACLDCERDSLIFEDNENDFCKICCKAGTNNPCYIKIKKEV